MTSNGVAFIIVGDEILRGQCQDTHTQYLARTLYAVGIKIKKVVVVPDEIDAIATEVAEASKSYPLVFTSGGVGPTHDDVTYEGVAKALGLALKEDERLLRELKALFPDRPESQLLALVPTPCELVHVTSPHLKDESRTYSVVRARNVYVLPGSPCYFRSAVDRIVPLLESGSPIRTGFLDIELDEFGLVELLDRQAERWRARVKIGSYPQPTLSPGAPPRTLISLESHSREDIARAKADIVAMLPKDTRVVVRFDEEVAEAVYGDRKHSEHLHRAFSVVEECYDKYRANEIFLSFNGGKDCTAVLHLAATFAKMRKLDPPLCLYVTGDDFPEVEEFVKDASRYYGLEVVYKEGTIRQALSNLLKERPELKACFLGTRKHDPGSEGLEPFSPTDSNWPAVMRVSPIIDWSYTQVWHFLLEHRVSYCSLYDKGYSSLGARSTTMRNPLLQDPKDPSKYLPAHTLADDSAERHGRSS
ncbi:FAD synthase [Copidosoma floridanum]|uniref:FAD synthase n=1 Tax=Copidosoma floridanum TaxID=29053 RepID=UPI0006C99208|nr:FAD synthase [Copidosoma floridanum]